MRSLITRWPADTGAASHRDMRTNLIGTSAQACGYPHPQTPVGSTARRARPVQSRAIEGNGNRAKGIQMTSTHTRAALAAIGAAIAVVGAGCGIGTSPDSSVAKTTDTYLRALASGDEAKACAQLTGEARDRTGLSCAARMKMIEAQIGSSTLQRAANGSISVKTAGQKGTATVAVLHATLAFKKDGFTWLITDGFALSS